MPEFSIDVDELGDDVARIDVNGFLDAHTFEHMEQAIEELFDAGTYKIIVNLQGVDYISSAGCGVFIGAIGEAKDHGGDILLLSPTKNVFEVFELLGLTEVFSFYKSVGEAMACFAS